MNREPVERLSQLVPGMEHTLTFTSKWGKKPKAVNVVKVVYLGFRVSEMITTSHFFYVPHSERKNIKKIPQWVQDTIYGIPNFEQYDKFAKQLISGYDHSVLISIEDSHFNCQTITQEMNNRPMNNDPLTKFGFAVDIALNLDVLKELNIPQGEFFERAIKPFLAPSKKGGKIRKKKYKSTQKRRK